PLFLSPAPGNPARSHSAVHLQGEQPHRRRFGLVGDHRYCITPPSPSWRPTPMKYALALCGLLAAWLILSLADPRRNEENRIRPRIPSYSWAEMSDIFAREKELDDELKKIQLYRKNQGAIEDSLR